MTQQVIRRTATWGLVAEEMAGMGVMARIGPASGPSEPIWFVKYAQDWWRAESGYLWTAVRMFNDFGPRVVIVPSLDEIGDEIVQVISILKGAA